MGLLGNKKNKKNGSVDAEEVTSAITYEPVNPDLLLLKMTESVISAKNKIDSNARSVVEKKKSDSVFFQKLPKNPFKGV